MAEKKDSKETKEIMVKIVKIDRKGDKAFRFFTIGKGGTILTAKIEDKVENYSEGQEVPASKLSLLLVANEEQIKRFNSASKRTIDSSLLL
jgi:hypothetical protein